MDGHNLAKQTLDQIPNANSNAKRIVGLVKKAAKSLDINYPTIPLWRNSKR